MKTLTIRWQRLVTAAGRTCDRCRDTGDTVNSAYSKLRKALAEMGIRVRLETEEIGLAEFKNDPLQSNRLWIGGRSLEKWIGAAVDKSVCCDVCGDWQCRTLTIGGNTYEAIPEKLILKAGLLAAAELVAKKRRSR